MLTVHLRVNDEATGKPTPVRLRISDASGRFYPPLGRFAEFPTGRNEAVGGHLMLNGEAWCYIDGTCEVPLPAGVPLRLQATKGPEFTPLDETFTLGPGQMALRFSIKRSSDLGSKGWYSGDSRCHFLTPHDAMLEAAAEDLDVVNLLAVEEPFGGFRTAQNLTAFSGQSAALEARGHMIAVNTLNVHAALGKVGLLYSHRPVFPLGARPSRPLGSAESPDEQSGRDGRAPREDWSLCDWCDQCHRKGGLTVWVDAFQESDEPFGGEALVAAILGKIDAIEITAFSPPVMEWIDRLWNAGFPIPLIGGSGKDSNTTALGATRTYAQLREGESFSYKAWIEAVRTGRSYVTDGTTRLPGLPPRAKKDGRSAASDVFVAERPSDLAQGGSPGLIHAVEATRRWIEAAHHEQPKHQQKLLDRCNEALARLEASS